MDNDQKIIRFLVKNKKKIEENPLLLRFLSNEDNLSLLKNYIIDPTDKNKNKVDMEFKAHCIKVRRISYINKLIHFFSQDFDKKRRKQRERNLLILDRASSIDSKTPIIDLVKDYRPESVQLSRNLMEEIENEKLIEALKTLTEKQLLIIDMIYHKNMLLKEVSIKLQTTPQNISNHHRTAIKKLKSYLSKEMSKNE